MTAKPGIENQPVGEIEWVKPTDLRANSYNPNHVAPPEMELLALSIMEDGWTQPIVARPDGEIVDGFHRFTVGSTHEGVKALTGGLLPVVRLRDADPAHQIMSTVRHNRARGTHAILAMSDIVQSLAATHGLDEAEIMDRLGMEDEEVERLIDTAGMTERGRKDGFNAGWEPN